MVTIREFTEGLSAIPEADFTHHSVLDYLRTHPVDFESVQPYVFFSAEHYTRNLIHRTPLFDTAGDLLGVRAGQRHP